MKFDGPMDSVYLNARNYVELDVGTGQLKLLLTLMLLLLLLMLRCLEISSRRHSCGSPVIASHMLLSVSSEIPWSFI